MATFSFAKTLFVASLLVLVISLDAARPMDQAPEQQASGPCMKHKLMTETICHDVCGKIGLGGFNFLPFTNSDPESVCCCCAQNSNSCMITPQPSD